MIFYLDESGSINNHLPDNNYFVVAMVRATDKDKLRRTYKRFVSANYSRLRQLDRPKKDPQTGQIISEGGKMFRGGRFHELKGSQFDRDMRKSFARYFSRTPCFELYYIRIDNSRLTDLFCKNTARAFNYTLRLALAYFLRKGYIPNEDCLLQLDERNERTESRYFLADYLNTELTLGGYAKGKFDVQYFDSANNDLVQVADVFSNLYYAHLWTDAYKDEMDLLKKSGILKFVFRFPLT